MGVHERRTMADLATGRKPWRAQRRVNVAAKPISVGEESRRRDMLSQLRARQMSVDDLRDGVVAKSRFRTSLTDKT